MQPVAGLAGPGKVDVTSKLFRPDRAMNEPLLIPDGLEGSRGHFRKQSLDVGIAERAEPHLGARLAGEKVRAIRIPRVEGSSIVDQPQTGVEVGLEEHVNVHIRAQIATVPDVARRRVDAIVPEGAGSSLDR